VKSVALIELRKNRMIASARKIDGRGRLDPGRVETALVVGRVLRDVDRGAAVLPAECQTLQQAQRDQMTGAKMPICAYVGRKPTRTVATPMTVIVTRKVYFRPMMSPSAPKKTAPNGRTRNPAA